MKKTVVAGAEMGRRFNYSAPPRLPVQHWRDLEQELAVGHDANTRDVGIMARNKVQ